MDLKVLRYLDPFYYFDTFWDRYIGKKGWSKTIADVIYTLLVAYLLYLLLGALLHTSKPAVIVASSSMEPVFYPGDIVIVRGISPSQISAPEVYIDTNLNFHVLPQQVGIRFVRRGLKLLYIEVNGKKIPVERNGTIIVYFDDLHGRDIIHRVILKIRTPRGYLFVTKGDNERTNPTADQDCILGRCVYPFLVSGDQVIGTPLFVIPRIGIIKLILWPFG